jgi:hypothetical protein
VVNQKEQQLAMLPKTNKEFLEVLKRAEKGDASTLPVLRILLQSSDEVERLGGNLARQAEQSLIAAAAGKNLSFKLALIRKLELMRAELEGSDPTPVERLLVERIVACWLQVQDADVRYAQAKGLGMEWGTYYQRRMDRAHKRYLSAIKALAVVRKLAVPVLQVNIARKQINVAGACPAPVENGAADEK